MLRLSVGASNGIGAATAALFAEQGAKIAGFDIREATTPATDNRIDIKVDVSSEEQVIAAVKQVVDTWGTIDVLCNVAGIADNMRTFIDNDPMSILTAGIQNELRKRPTKTWKESWGSTS